MTPQELKNSILKLAIQGKLVEQRPEEGTAEELYQQLNIKKPKDLKPIKYEDLPFEIPNSWMWLRHNELFEIVGGSQPPKSHFRDENKEGYIRLYQTRDYGEKPIPVYVPKKEVTKFTVKGDILLARYGGSVGKVFWAEDGAYNVAMARVTPLFDGEGLLPEFMYYYYLAPLYQFLVKNNSRSAQAGFNKEDLNSLLLPLPPFAEQKRIVAKIEELLPYIDRYEQAWSKLEDFNKRFPTDMQKSILQTAIKGKLVEQRAEEGFAEDLIPLCRDDKARSIREGKYKKEAFHGAITNNDCIPFEIPDSWTWMFISDMSLFQEGPGIMAVDFRSAGVPLIRIAGMQTDIVSLEGCNYLDEDMVISKWSHFRLDLGDIVISTSASMDKIAEVNEECVGSIPYTGLIRFKMYGGIDKNYFKWFINSPCYMKQVDEQKAGGTIKHYGPSHLKKMVIPLPPLAEQERIVAKLEEILPLCEKLK